jgi:hypothetical protein
MLHSRTVAAGSSSRRVFQLTDYQRLRGLPEENVKKRNEELGAERFKFAEESGISFAVWKHAAEDHLSKRVTVKVNDDLKTVIVTFGSGLPLPTTTYGVRVDDEGECRLHKGGVDFLPWQVLKMALEPLLFG